MGTEPEPQDVSSTTARFGAIGAGEDTTARADVPPPDMAAIDGLPPGHALLIVQRGPAAGARFLLDTDRTAPGRHPTADIFLEDLTGPRRPGPYIAHAGGDIGPDAAHLAAPYVTRDRLDR